MKDANQNGTQFSARQLPDLLQPHFKVDDRSFSDLVGYMASFLDQINFFNLVNEPDGTWRQLIQDDPVMYMVMISHQRFNTHKIVDKDPLDPRTPGQRLIAWYKLLEQWARHLRQYGEQEVALKITYALENVLSYHYEEMVREEQDNDSEINLKVREAQYNPAKNTQFAHRIHTFEKVIQYIQDSIRQHLDQHDYRGNGDHQPHNAMYLAFAALYRRIQEQTNTYTQKHLDYYYKEILQQHKRSAKNGRITACFDLLPSVQTSRVPKGTVLSAGKPFEGEDEVLVKTTADLSVNQAQLISMQNFTLGSNPYLQVGTELPMVSSISTQSLMAEGKLQGTLEDRDIFGSNPLKKYSSVVDPSTVAELGFIIGAPVLHLSEGHRKICMNFFMEAESACELFWNRLHDIAASGSMSLERACYETFADAFLVSHTSKKGWVSLEGYRLSCDEQQHRFTVELELSPLHPALEVFTAPHPSPDQPAIQIKLNPYASTFAYSFFNGLELDRIELEVAVSEMKNLSVYNSIGKMTPGKPFEAFGPVPEVGAYFMVGKPELFQKKLQRLTIDLEWMGLPNTYGGMESYYHLYPGNITHESFQVQTTVLTQGYWQPQQEHAPVKSIFDIKNAVTPEGYDSFQLDSHSQLELQDMEVFHIQPEKKIEDPLLYHINSTTGFVKFTLAGPQMGFGNELYPELYSEMAAYNAQHKRQLPLPGKPLVPKIKQLHLSYKASDTLYLKETITRSKSNANHWEFYHSRPFGMDAILTPQTPLRQFGLLPSFETRGNLFMAFSGVEEGTIVSLFFHFLRSDETIQLRENSLCWYYYHEDSWRAFEPKHILQDRTAGFLKTGIIQLQLPKVPLAASGERSHYWVKVTTDQDPAYFPRLQGIYLNAVEAVCISESPGIIGRELPPNQKLKPVEKLSDIKRAYQPAASFAGALAETDEAYYTRVSERLRHKDRAVSTWDYERLLLDNFKELNIVKCTNLNRYFRPTPGKVTVAVMGKRWTNQNEYYTKGKTLAHMADFLKRRSSGFHTIQVINPEVEYLLVNCSVSFTSRETTEWNKQQLNQDIIAFLSPISSPQNDIRGIGTKINITMVTGYMEKLPYVDQVHHLFIEHIIQQEQYKDRFVLEVYTDRAEMAGAGASRERSQLSGTTPWSVLMPLQQHLIQTPDDVNLTDDAAIGNMQIGEDMIVMGTDTFPLQLMRSAKAPGKVSLLTFNSTLGHEK